MLFVFTTQTIINTSGDSDLVSFHKTGQKKSTKMELGKYYTTVNVILLMFKLFSVELLHKTKILGLNG